MVTYAIPYSLMLTCFNCVKAYVANKQATQAGFYISAQNDAKHRTMCPDTDLHNVYKLGL